MEKNYKDEDFWKKMKRNFRKQKDEEKIDKYAVQVYLSDISQLKIVSWNFVDKLSLWQHS